MIQESGGLLETPAHQRRWIGRAGDGDGPTMIIVTGMHGNEPAGGLAAERVIGELERRGTAPRGTLVALSGNLKALAERTRFLDRDLNRCWSPERVARVLAADHEPFAEAEEMRDLLLAIREVVRDATGPLYFLDLHTTSAEGPPFVTVGDTMRNRRFARRFPLPLILGLEEQVDGALLEYLNNFGLVTMGVEGGQHDRAGSVDRLEALIWLAAMHTGMIELDEAEQRRHTELLEQASAGVPRVLEVRYRHEIHERDGFVMRSGYDNFVPVDRGEVVAQDRTGPIACPEDGRMLLPLYQGKGNDGFFVARSVRPFWLRLSALLRRWNVYRFLPLLPGVRRGTQGVDELIVDTRIARLYPLEIFHLLGYRKRRSFGTALVVSRRAFDFAAPERTRL